MALYDTLIKLGLPLEYARRIEAEFGAADPATWISGMQTVAQLARDGGSQPTLPPTVEPWQTVHAAILDALEADPQAKPERVAGRVFDDQWPAQSFALDTVLHACYLKTKPRVTFATPASVLAPPLPPEVSFSPTPPPAWLSQYVEYGMCVSPMTPRAMHESAGLWLLSTAVARRLVLRMHYGEVYPNLYVLWVAGTTLYRKSTALKVARDMAHKLMPELMAAAEGTPESILSDLAGREPNGFDKMTPYEQDVWKASRNYAGQRGWLVDEFSGLLASAGRDYNAGLLESILRFYDCDAWYTRSTRNQGRVTVQNCYVALLGATTPTAVSNYLTEPRLWENGWWPRFAILSPESLPAWAEPREPSAGLVVDIESGLQSLLNRLPRAIYPNLATPIDVTIDLDARNLWAAYNRAMAHTLLSSGEVDSRLFGAYGRLPSAALKVATLFAALNWRTSSGPPRMTLEHLSAALTITEQWRSSAHRVLDLANATAGDQMWTRVLKVLLRFQPDGATLRDVYRAMQDKSAEEVENTLKQLARAGEVVAYTHQPAGQGRPSTRFKLA